MPVLPVETVVSQENRIGRLVVPPNDESLVLLEFSGTEAVNQISSFNLRALSPNTPANLDELLGKPMMVEVETRHGDKRQFHLIVYSAHSLGNDARGYLYEFELRPWLWLLQRRATSRIFQQKSIIDIIREVFDDLGQLVSASFRDQTEGSYPELEYVVQYRETDLDFVRRLLEENGINFHFEMSTGAHVMVLTSSTDGFGDAPKGRRIHIASRAENTRGFEHFEGWSQHRTVTTGAVRLQEYDFKTPHRNMEVESSDSRGYNGAGLESYDYPGRYIDTGQGGTMARRRLDAMRMHDSTINAEGELASLGAGMKFILSEAGEDVETGEYAVLSAQHHFSSNSYRSGGTDAGSYRGRYVLTKAGNPVAPEPVTPRPVVRGPQTAMVVDGGDSGVDEYGRIVVRFHWDTNASSMPCRVSQLWASSGWGGQFIPHTGMEVIVDFLEGDPDRPIVVGCVYNDSNRHPWPLPDQKTISGIKTVRDNHLLFDDKSGNERIEILGQRDMKVMVLNDSVSETTGHNNNTIGKDRSVKVDGKETKKIAGALLIESQTKIELKVGSSSITIDNGEISLKAISIKIAATGQLETSGLTASHTAKVDLAVSAAIVRINS